MVLGLEGAPNQHFGALFTCLAILSDNQHEHMNTYCYKRLDESSGLYLESILYHDDVSRFAFHS
ncbi:hypothetical protein CHH92_16900 [Bacillus sonorensis]|uniref:Uncharacterized protein n=1 Tax=Bacillus sonorensis L12 TaxID=1274524 RepID=M5PCP3_9BACI|nr:hypothetical protein BSONL12_13686 [Bacillus sonorensis L12]MBG9913472.1 hypothetical protein [Bacillus sonorensis]PAD59061.1 hypothetical protein CHH92_16900 [Bacillus sonorensis]RHJ07069.1 hypothetical protein DW143_18560 [Bacillus sonorensis]TWK75300.1 hypothetical protein CHCC20335_1032 [Bacillus paralicheniformis]